MKTAILTALLVLLGATLPRAGSLPDLHHQAAWGDKEKKEFLGFLKSNQPMPSGQVKYTSPESPQRSPSKARYASLGMAADTMMIDAGGGKTRTESTTIGPKLLVGGHLFSWVRYYSGVKYNHIGQDKLDGTRAHLTHIAIPAGLELALIPLGTPQTRYVLLRGGVSEHFFSGPAKKSDFKAPLLGWHSAWNLGLGYEWQFANSPWRFHTLAEGYRSFAGGGVAFYGLGLTAGFVYTF